jgi:ABC-type antimicrobial peptide transport system permease subunit
VRNHGPREAGEGQLYMAYLQQPQGPMFVVARSDRDPATLAPALRRVVRGIDAQLPVGRLEPMPEVVARAVSGERFQLLVLGGFAALALVLAAVGLYGVTAYLVSQRTPELGLRLALGGRPRDVTRLVVGEGLAVAGAGLAAGVVAALGLARVMAGLLYGVRPTDPPTYAGIAALLLAVCLLACWVPARRAARTDPARTLRA